MTSRRALLSTPLRVAIAVTVVLTVLRTVLLFFYGTALGPDEAQYWFWARSFEFGYYSKPPLIAWLIGLTTGLFGDSPATVRLSSPALLGVSGLFLFATANRLFGKTSAFASLAMWHLMPATMLGATILTTDIPLLAAWCVALWAFVLLTEGTADGRRRVVLLGVAVGVGLLAKYAMAYFALCAVLVLGVRPDLRTRAFGSRMLGAAGIAGLVALPNLVWNAQNGFQTFGHTSDNADWDGLRLRWDEAGQFLTDQLGILGPFLFPALLVGLTVALVRWRRGEPDPRTRLLIPFAIVPIVLIVGQALLSRAHANWAVAAYPAALILLGRWLIVGWRRWVLGASLALHAGVGLAFTALVLVPAWSEPLGLANAAKRLRGWSETRAQLIAAMDGYDALIVDDREIAAHLVWELRDTGIEIRVVDPDGHRDNSYEYALPLTTAPGERLLLVVQEPFGGPAYDPLRPLTEAGTVFVDLKAERYGTPYRTLFLYRSTPEAAVSPPA